MFYDRVFYKDGLLKIFKWEFFLLKIIRYYYFICVWVYRIY